MQLGVRFVAAALVASQLGGCSLLFLNKAPSNVPEGAWADCSESLVFPVIDAVYGTASVIGAVGGTVTTGDDDPTTNDSDAGYIVGPMYGLLGLAYLYSAYVGFRETSRCSNIHGAAEARGIYGPQPYYPPQPYPYPYPPQPYPYPTPQPAPAPQAPPPAPAPQAPQ